MYEGLNVIVFIPVYNPSEDFYIKTIPLLKSQSVRHKLYLISSSGDIDVKDSMIEVIDKIDFSHSNTRNSVLKYDADFYLFMTQDAVAYDNNLIENLLDSFKDSEAVVSYARQVPNLDASPSEKFARETNYPENSSIKSLEDISKYGIKTFFSSNSCAMYRGDYFRKMKGFALNLNTSEDMEVAARAVLDGYKIAYNSNAKVYHSHNYTLKSLYARYKAIGLFFHQNRWILDAANKHHNIEKTGFTQVVKEIKHILVTKPSYLPLSLSQIAVKYIAYKIGIKGNK